MSDAPIPPKDKLGIAFAHVAYRAADHFARRNTGIPHFQVWSRDELDERAADYDVLVISGLWRNEILQAAPRLKYVQSLSVGINQYDVAAFKAAGVRLANARGANENAVAEHALALMLALARKIPSARDHQARKAWRGMIGDATIREEELGGKTLLIVGLGTIGQRLAKLAKALDMTVIGVRRDPSAGKGAADEVVPQGRFLDALPRADVVALTCPLTPETEGMIGEAALACMKTSAYLINVARGRVVDEPALIESLSKGGIAGAALDCAWEEPLPPKSPLWSFENVLVTPHTGGETRAYEERIIDVLMENLERLWRGEARLRNEIA